MPKFSVYLVLFLLVCCAATGISQSLTELDADTTDFSISQFDIYNPVLGGDSIRVVNGIRLNGPYKDYHANGQVMHNGMYDKGSLIYYRNFYENGQPERIFAASGGLKHRLKVFYPDGTPKSDVVFHKGRPRQWTDYHPNGVVEFDELYHRSMEYYIHLRFFNSQGQPMSILEMENKARRIYINRVYHSNGKLAEEGRRAHNKWVGDYQRIGTWMFYDEEGRLQYEEEYVKGVLIEERKHGQTQGGGTTTN